MIIGAYQAGSEKVNIVFEGTDDEYRELESICSGEDYAGKVALYKSSKYLENARDILPDVIDVFKELRRSWTRMGKYCVRNISRFRQ